MNKAICNQIAALRKIHAGLTEVIEQKREIVVAGSLPFEASYRDYPSIEASFEIELHIPSTYPNDLPEVLETSEKISRDYPHVLPEGFLCLETPAGELEQFCKQPVLRGYVNRLVIPYLYGYCYWKKFGKHPFGEHAHGGAGIIQYYTEQLQLERETSAVEVVRYLYERGYNKNDPCPCRSGKVIRDCHKKELQHLARKHTKKNAENGIAAYGRICPETTQH